MDTDKKKSYIDLLQKIEIDPDIKNPLLNFIESYDGTNHEDLTVLILTNVFLLSKYAQLELKALAYDAMAENNKDYKEQLAALKAEYERFNKDKAPAQQPHVSGKDTSNAK